MYNAVIRVSLDINKSGSQVNIPMFYGDTNRTIVFSLTENGKPFRLDDCIVAFTGKKSDGNFLNNACEIDLDKQVVIYELNKDDNNRQTTMCVGGVECQLVVKKQEVIDNETKTYQVASPYFLLTVHKTVYNEEEILASESTLGALDQLYVPVSRTINGNKLDRNISRENLFNNLFIVQGSKPTVMSYIGDLRLVGLIHADRDPYMLVGQQNGGKPTWRKLILDKDIINLVSNTLKIAGLELKKDITVDELKIALGIDDVITDEQLSNAISEYFKNNPFEPDGLVPETRKVADQSLNKDISVFQLQTALGIGEIETALDSIISIQENLIGGATE